MTLNGAEIWVFCSCAELWIGCETAISSGHPRDRQATLPKTHSASPRLVPRARAGDRQAPGAPASASMRRPFPGHAPGKHSRTQWKYSDPNPTGLHSRASQKSIAAKLLAAGFWISLQKAWHMDQSRMASPIQDLVHSRIFLQDKTQVNPSGIYLFSVDLGSRKEK